MRNIFIAFGLLNIFSLGVLTASAEEVNDPCAPEMSTFQPTYQNDKLNINDVDIDMEGLIQSLEPDEHLITNRVTSVGLSGTSHVQSYGWQEETRTGDVITLGSVGRGLRMEAMQLFFWHNGKRSGDIKHRAHVQSIGWQSYVKNGYISGTTNKGLRMEAVSMFLSGKKTNGYSIKYHVHVSKKGWLKWVDAREAAGTTGQRLQIEAIQIALTAMA